MDYINPPLNFTGSKFKLLDQILPKMNYDRSIFVDVFAGGGSVYTNVLDKYENVVVNDVISDLVKIHRLFANNPDAIINQTKELATCKEDKEKYLALRAEYNQHPTPDKLLALMLSCTSNLMRFNKSFKFNQTWGKRGWNDSTEKKAQAYAEHLSKYKDKIQHISRNFYDVPLIPDGMYYLDPPYINTNGAGYNAYWSKELEETLYTYIHRLHKNDKSIMLSGVLTHDGNESELLNKLIKDGFNCTELNYNYNKVSRKKGVEKNTTEAIITNY